MNKKTQKKKAYKILRKVAPPVLMIILFSTLALIIVHGSLVAERIIGGSAWSSKAAEKAEEETENFRGQTKLTGEMCFAAEDSTACCEEVCAKWCGLDNREVSDAQVSSSPGIMCECSCS